MWIPKTASAEFDIFPNAEVEGRFPLSGGEFSLTTCLILSLPESIRQRLFEVLADVPPVVQLDPRSI